MIDKLEILFWKLAKHILKKGYGYCDVRVDSKFMREGRCGCCNASDVQDWIDSHIDLIKWDGTFNKELVNK